MRTTLIIPDPIYKRAKKIAQEQKKTLSELASEALEIQILKWGKASKEKRRPYKLRTFSMGRERVDISNREVLYRKMEE
jgi:hypothetical protein